MSGLAIQPVRARHVLGWVLALLVVAIFHTGDLGAAGDSAVVDAAKKEDLAAVRALIAQRANVNATSSDGSSALLWAAYHGDADMARTLIAAGAAINAPNKYGLTPLLQASRTGAASVMQVLLRAGADPKWSHPDGE